MQREHIDTAITGVDIQWKDLLVGTLRQQFGEAILDLNNELVASGKTLLQLCPQPNMLFNAFRLCRYDCTKVVLIGQDPYIKPNEAMGLSFSVPGNFPIPPSLRAIYSMMLSQGLIKEMPKHGLLTSWAEQGVLLLNLALTTVLYKSRAHTKVWARYTTELIRLISHEKKGLLFILLGTDAKSLISCICKTNMHVISVWGHPSPLNQANLKECEANFKYCPSFRLATDMFGIDWDLNYEKIQVQAQLETYTANEVVEMIADEPIVTTNHALITTREPNDDDPIPTELDSTYLFTDGGCTDNGKDTAKGSFAFCIFTGTEIIESVDVITDNASNNKAELNGIISGMRYILQNVSVITTSNLIIVSDSQYSIKCITEWYPNWVRQGKLTEKKNTDLIAVALELYVALGAIYTVRFVHVRGHQTAPLNTESEEWFTWKGNDIVDKLCSSRL